ncbi:sulfotransferase family protein [Aspergillus stella-maris]|uniref:sulfotransferase family protein n=1 Tax=Aspergillus stella-maris TaxID=1810926 RepID=UPI003CCCBAD2
MKVLALGLCRTGTDCENPRDCELWYEALRAKYDGVGKPFGREAFNQLLGNCQAVCDFPAAAFAEELIEAYPEAKVILIDRDVNKWHRMPTVNSSVKQTFEPVLSHPLLPLWQLLENVFIMHTRWLQPTWKKIWKHYFNNNFKANGCKAFRAHYARVKEIVPPENLLVYKVSEGWEPLCKFLGQPLPRQPYPTGNQVSVFQKRFQDALFYNAKEMVEKSGRMLVLYVCFRWLFKITKS